MIRLQNFIADELKSKGFRTKAEHSGDCVTVSLNRVVTIHEVEAALSALGYSFEICQVGDEVMVFI